MRIIHRNCDPELANDRSLPYTAYLVEYFIDGAVAFDLVVTNKRVDIFDYYWDLYREDLISIKQSEGRVNPKLWQDPSSKKEKQEKGKRK
jgi:hypothetical protein